MYTSAIAELREKGVVVIQVPSKKLIDLRNQFLSAKHVEFITENPKQLIMGAYGALGHPTSFHHPSIRKIRRKVHRKLRGFRKPIIEEDDKNLELLFDRFSIRKPGTKLMVESWHRDICSIKIDGDIIYGGWINLDDIGSEPQLFSCIPGTHIEKSKDSGFAKIEKEQAKEYKAMKIPPYKIPPGHIIIFNQNIVHEVISKAYKTETYKMYIGWRLTDQIEPLFKENLTTAIENQGIVKIPSGQMPAMYAANHRRFFAERVREFSKQFSRIYIDEAGYVNRFLPSLKESGLPLLPPYKAKDIHILKPHKL